MGTIPCVLVTSVFAVAAAAHILSIMLSVCMWAVGHEHSWLLFLDLLSRHVIQGLGQAVKWLALFR